MDTTSFLNTILTKLRLGHHNDSSPDQIILNITHNCNCSCKICDIILDKKPNLDISCIKNILKEAWILGIQNISLSGGEPLTRPDIFEILSYAKSLQIKNLGLLSNGITSANNFEKLKPFLLDKTINLIISFDSLTPKIHNTIRNKNNAWEQAVRTFDLIHKLKIDHPKANVFAQVTTIVLNENLEELPEIIPFLKKKNINAIQFQCLLPNNHNLLKRHTQKKTIPAKRMNILDKTIKKLIQLKTTDPYYIKNSTENLELIKKYYGSSLKQTAIRCKSASKVIFISNEGDCSTCFTTYGNLKEQSLEKIIKSKQIKQARKKVLSCKSPCLLPCFCDRDNIF